MANRLIGKIVLYENLDQDKLTEILAGTDTVYFQIEQSYLDASNPEMLGVVLPTQFNDVTVDYVDAFKKVVDISTWQMQENAIIWKINFDGVDEFDLTSSYVRDSKDTLGVLTGITIGTELTAVFYTPSFTGKVRTEITLPYGQAISTTDYEKLLAVGIELNLGYTGSLFSIKTSVNPIQVDFYKPASVLDNYVIDFNYKNKTIEI